MDELGGALIGLIVLYVAVIILMIVSQWIIFEKAGQPGWASIVPIYNAYVEITQILRMPPIWFFLLLIPCVNILVAIPLFFIIPFKMAEEFGKDAGFGVGLLLLPFIFFPILAFGDAQYQGGSSGGGGGMKKSFKRFDKDEDDDRW